MLINDLLKIAVDRSASDLHLKVGAHPVIRVDGTLIPLVELRPLMQEESVAMAFSIMSARQKEKFKNNFEIDIAYSVPNLGRFRCNIFQQQFLHRDKKSIINQREVDVDTKGFSIALRSALRQDPDIILVGEMRDYETIETALIAAETGHLVLSTLHTLDATETVNRIISVVPPHQQKQIRLQLGSVIRAILSMRLMPRADGLGRVPAVEILIRTGYVRECIENKEKTSLLRDAIQAGTSQYGMQTFDQSLYGLYRAGLITLEEALRRATNPNEFRLKIQGIQSTSDVAQEAMDSVLEMPTDFTPIEEESPFDFSNQVPPAR
jgi:Tfp pilus assembly pilus retraction ATPase PilT